MILSKCVQCDNSFWLCSDRHESQICDYCENLPLDDKTPYAPALFGKLCWLPAEWASVETIMPQHRPSHFIKSTSDGHFLVSPAAGQAILLRLGQIVPFLAYRMITSFVLDVGQDYHDAWPVPSPVANKFTLNRDHYSLADSVDTIAALVRRHDGRLSNGSYDAFATWWSTQLYSHMFCVDEHGRAYFTPVIDSAFAIAYCNDDGRIGVASSLDDVPTGTILLGSGCVSAIHAAIDAHAQIVDGNQHIPDMADFCDFENRLSHLDQWQSKHFPHSEWRLHTPNFNTAD